MSLPKHHLELLSPARDVAIAREAILHGADAIYIGGPSFGARHNACNEVSDIAGWWSSPIATTPGCSPPSTPSCTTTSWSRRAS
jgi:heptaprenylglyceryl phosphate synthase